MVDVTTGRARDVALPLTYRRAAPSEKYVIHAGRLVDMKSDVARENMDVVVDGAYIVSVAPHSAAAHANTRVVDATAQTVGGSFKLLSAREKANLKPLRIRVMTVRPGQTVGSISASMVGVDRKLELFRVLNALAPGATVSAGDKVKIITDR